MKDIYRIGFRQKKYQLMGYFRTQYLGPFIALSRVNGQIIIEGRFSPDEPVQTDFIR